MLHRVVMYYTPGQFFKIATGCLVHHYSYPSAQFDGNYTLENLYGQFDETICFFKLMGRDGGTRSWFHLLVRARIVGSTERKGD